MSSTESEVSNDEGVIISELLNSTEPMQTSTVSASNNINDSMKSLFQQECDLQIVPTDPDMATTFNNAAKQNLMVSVQQDYTTDHTNYYSPAQFADVQNLNKMQIRQVHIPYILNGELYQIQTQDGENVTVKCCHCPPDRVYRGSVRSTGNFHMHIKRRHPDLLEKLHNMKVNALLERRDRLMRNRKIPQRNNRNRLSNSSCNLSEVCSLRNEEKPALTSISSTTTDPMVESSMLHTHKLKIKTVFQRHQMQQRKAEEMRNWSNAEYVEMPICSLKSAEECEQPINYSLKPKGDLEVVDPFSTNSSVAGQQSQQLHEKVTSEKAVENLNNSNNQLATITVSNTEGNNAMFENHSNSIVTTSVSSCPSATSSLSEGQQFEVEANRAYNNFYFQHQNLSIIKPEQLLLSGESEAIDLTMHTDSGIFSSSEDNEFGNNNNDNSINEGRVDSHNSSNECVSNKDNISKTKWIDLLKQVEGSLRDIQREMNVRNQIESNRMFLDIAKFKFLNPNFQFNW